MGHYERKDHYWKKAKAQGLPSRATFKIEEILQRYRLVKRGDWVLDLGAAPGGWTVQLLKSVGLEGKVLAVDLKPMPKIQAKNLIFFLGDMEAPEILGALENTLQERRVTSIFSDMSPQLSGIPFRDAYLSYELCRLALKSAHRWLAPGGALVVKIFPGEEFNSFFQELKNDFRQVKTVEPQATRKTSREVYLVAQGFQSKN